jgi:hypothetical protein
MIIETLEMENKKIKRDLIKYNNSFYNYLKNFLSDYFFSFYFRK